MLNATKRRLCKIFERLKKRLQNLINGLSGKDRREKQRLLRHLSTLRANYNLLQKTMKESQRFTNLELRGLAVMKKQAENERDDLQLQVWELQQQVEELLSYIARLQRLIDSRIPELSMSVESAPFKPNPNLDLAHIILGLVGGHPATRKEVLEELSVYYGLESWVEIPPLREATIRKNRLRKKLRRCNLIVIIADYMGHPLFRSINGLRGSGALTAEVALLNCHGKSGVIREILHLVRRRNTKR